VDVSGSRVGVVGIVCTHQSAHGAVKSMPVVPPELGVGALERGVTVGLRLLDTAVPYYQLMPPGLYVGD
jgi:hypothetical protein